jgi:diguanylate cyclase (GGDEF)-like protein
LGLATLPQTGPHGPTAALVVVFGAGTAHFVARWLTGVPNPTGWLDLIAVMTATAVAWIAPDVWAAALLFQMLVLGGAVSFLPPRWTASLGAWSVVSMSVVAAASPDDIGGALSMLIVATVFFPVLLAGARRKQARITRASHRMEAVAASLPMVVWEWDVTDRSMSAIVGRSDELFRRPIEELLERGFADHIHPDDRPNVVDTYRRLIRLLSDEQAEVEYRYVRPDGTTVWLRDQATIATGPRGPVMRGVTIDVSETRALGIALHRHHQVVERMPTLTIVLDDAARLRERTVLQVVDPIGWGETEHLDGLSFAQSFPELASRPELVDAIDRIVDGEVAEVGPWSIDDPSGDRRSVEVEAVLLADRSVALLVSDVTERETMVSQLRHQARHDSLTGLLNRAALLQAADEALHRGARCSLVLVDLNDFKSINDTLGHLTGDHYLAVIAERLEEMTISDEHVTRLGGDEFAVLVVEPAPGRTESLVDAVVRACRQPVTLDGVPIAGSASVGVAQAPFDARDSESLLRCADIAMYHAKTNQTGASHYSQQMERTTDPLRLLGQLGEAFDKGEFVMHFQPQLDVKTGRTVAFEALVRWRHPQFGVLAPPAFLDLIGVSGQLDALASIAIRQAAHALAQLPDHIDVAINLTAANLRNLSLPGLCLEVFDEVGVDLRRLTVEVTESHVFDTSGVSTSVLDDLADRGVRVSVDDFGTGYSSLSHLRSLPIHELKIDRQFVGNLLTEDQDLVIVRSMIDLGHNLGLSVVAEGVEDAETLGMLRTLGCDLVQGYHLGRPATLVDAIARCHAEDALDRTATAVDRAV